MSGQYDWRYENSINFGKEKLDLNTQDVKYNQWRTNSTLSNFIDSIEKSNDMNIRHQNITDQMHYDYLFQSIRKQKRYGKRKTAEDKRLERLQSEEDAKIELISNYYKYNYKKAREALSILTESQLEMIKTKMEIGGIK